MTTKEVEVTTEQIETEEITFCDSCGADERTAELVTLVENPHLELVHTQTGGRTRYGMERFVSPESRSRVAVEHDGQLDACEACLAEHFNEEAATPLFELEPRETATQELETDVSGWGDSRLTLWTEYAKLAFLWVLFPLNMSVVADMNGTFSEEGDPFQDTLDYTIAASQLLVWFLAIALVL